MVCTHKHTQSHLSDPVQADLASEIGPFKFATKQIFFVDN